MTTLPTLTDKTLISALARAGFETVRIRGSHHAYGIPTVDAR